VSFYHPRRDSYEPDEKPAMFRLKLASTSADRDHDPDHKPSDSRFVLEGRRWLLEVRGLGVVMIDCEDRMLIFTLDEIQFG
jgi:hypothetical protein